MGNILVTGAGGFIGLNLVSELNSQGHKVYALIQSGDYSGREKLLHINPNIVLFENLQEMMNNASQLASFDSIYHLAAVGVKPNYDNINLLCDVNIKLACQMVDFAKANNSRLLVNFGSCFEYGDHGDVLLTEDMDCRPESLYAISKNAATNLVINYAKKRSINLITVRPFGVFGEGEDSSRLAPTIIQSCLKGKTVQTTHGKQIRDFLNVKDLVKATIILSESNYTSYEIYNICSDNPVCVKDFIMEIVDVCGFEPSLIDFGGLPYRDDEAMVFAGDNKKLQRIINYPFPNNHRDGIIDVFNYLRIP